MAVPGGGRRPGVIRGDAVVDLSEVFPSLLNVIAGGELALARVRELSVRRAASLPLAELELLAPLPQPRRNLFAAGWNYPEQFAGSTAASRQLPDVPEHPTFFTKLPSTVTGPRAPVPFDPAVSARLDYEAELAVVVGIAGRNLPPERALEHVFGYTAANDVSARDIQRSHGGQWFRGKSLDRTCPMGPVLVTADEIPDPQDLELSCTVNGQVRQSARTSSMAFPVAVLLAELSRGITLQPGDILLTGTPSGVGYARTPPQYLRPGDEVVVSVSGIGELRNPIVAEDRSSYWRAE